jgi:hypothetical protein
MSSNSSRSRMAGRHPAFAPTIDAGSDPPRWPRARKNAIDIGFRPNGADPGGLSRIAGNSRKRDAK